VRSIVTNTGNIRLYIVASLVWMAVTGLVFWKPIAPIPGPIPNRTATMEEFTASLTVLNDRISKECSGAALNDPYDICAKSVELRVSAETERMRAGTFRANVFQVITWLSIVLFLPIILPIMLFSAAIVLQWIRDGYGSSTKA
jgi:hypothetical protein